MTNRSKWWLGAGLAAWPFAATVALVIYYSPESALFLGLLAATLASLGAGFYLMEDGRT